MRARHCHKPSFVTTAGLVTILRLPVTYQYWRYLNVQGFFKIAGAIIFAKNDV